MLLRLFPLALCLVGLPTPADAAITATRMLNRFPVSGIEEPLVVGNHGIGTLDVSGGSTLSTTYGGFVGLYPGSTGTVTVTGAGSAWLTSGHTYGLIVGDQGTGAMSVTDGGLVTSDGGGIGEFGSWNGHRSGGWVNVDHWLLRPLRRRVWRSRHVEHRQRRSLRGTGYTLVGGLPLSGSGPGL